MVTSLVLFGEVARWLSLPGAVPRAWAAPLVRCLRISIELLGPGPHLHSQHQSWRSYTNNSKDDPPSCPFSPRAPL